MVKTFLKYTLLWLRLARTADAFDIGGEKVLVASIDDLIRMKRAAGRPKDLLAVEHLGALRDVLDQRPPSGGTGR